MKLIKTLFIFIPSLLAFSAAHATINDSDISGKQKIGTVSAANAYSLDDLTKKLSDQADKAGASSFRITSAGGSNKLFGTAEIYK